MSYNQTEETKLKSASKIRNIGFSNLINKLRSGKVTKTLPKLNTEINIEEKKPKKTFFSSIFDRNDKIEKKQKLESMDTQTIVFKQPQIDAQSINYLESVKSEEESPEQFAITENEINLVNSNITPLNNSMAKSKIRAASKKKSTASRIQTPTSLESMEIMNESKAEANKSNSSIQMVDQPANKTENSQLKVKDLIDSLILSDKFQNTNPISSNDRINENQPKLDNFNLNETILSNLMSSLKSADNSNTTLTTSSTQYFCPSTPSSGCSINNKISITSTNLPQKVNMEDLTNIYDNLPVSVGHPYEKMVLNEPARFRNKVIASLPKQIDNSESKQQEELKEFIKFKINQTETNSQSYESRLNEEKLHKIVVKDHHEKRLTYSKSLNQIELNEMNSNSNKENSVKTASNDDLETVETEASVKKVADLIRNLNSQNVAPKLPNWKIVEKKNNCVLKTKMPNNSVHSSKPLASVNSAEINSLISKKFDSISKVKSIVKNLEEK